MYRWVDINTQFLPVTKFGLCSCLLFLGMFLFAVLGVIIQESSRFPAIVAWLLGLIGAAVGAISFFKQKERSVLVALVAVLETAVVVLGVIPG